MNRIRQYYDLEIRHDVVKQAQRVARGEIGTELDEYWKTKHGVEAVGLRMFVHVGALQNPDMLAFLLRLETGSRGHFQTFDIRYVNGGLFARRFGLPTRHYFLTLMQRYALRWLHWKRDIDIKWTESREAKWNDNDKSPEVMAAWAETFKTDVIAHIITERPTLASCCVWRALQDSLAAQLGLGNELKELRAPKKHANDCQ